MSERNVNPQGHPEKDGNSRREFLKAAGVAAAGVAAVTAAGSAVAATKKSSKYSLAASRVIGANDRIGIGHIGVGGQGNAHLRILRDHAQENNTQSVAVNDVYDRRRDGALNAIGGAAKGKAYKNYEDLLADPNVDVVFIATPEHWHAKQTLDSIAAGKDVYLEKPMTRHLDEALAVYKAVKASDRIVQIGSQGCSDAKWHTAGRIVREGKIGHKVWSQASYARNNPNGEWNYNIETEGTPTSIDWAQWLGPAPKREFSAERFFRWRKYWDYSSGILSDLFPHRLNPFMIALGGAEWPSRVACTGGIFVDTDNNNPDREVADTTHLLVDYPSGHTIFVAGTTVNQQGLNDMIRGHKATLFFGGSGVEIRPEEPFSDEIDRETVPVIGPGEDIAVHEKNFLDCVRTRKQPNCPVDIAAPVQVTICLAEMAYKNNKQMRFDSEKMKVIS